MAINNRHKTCQHLLYCLETVLVCHLCKTVNSLQQGDEIRSDDGDGDCDDIYTPLSDLSQSSRQPHGVEAVIVSTLQTWELRLRLMSWEPKVM